MYIMRRRRVNEMNPLGDHSRSYSGHDRGKAVDETTKIGVGH